MEFVIFMVILVLVLVALGRTATQNRKYTQMVQPRLCRHCALPHPPFAAYCRRCGRMLI